MFICIKGTRIVFCSTDARYFAKYTLNTRVCWPSGIEQYGDSDYTDITRDVVIVSITFGGVLAFMTLDSWPFLPSSSISPLPHRSSCSLAGGKETDLESSCSFWAQNKWGKASASIRLIDPKKRVCQGKGKAAHALQHRLSPRAADSTPSKMWKGGG